MFKVGWPLKHFIPSPFSLWVFKVRYESSPVFKLWNCRKQSLPYIMIVLAIRQISFITPTLAHLHWKLKFNVHCILHEVLKRLEWKYLQRFSFCSFHDIRLIVITFWLTYMLWLACCLINTVLMVSTCLELLKTFP